MHVNLSQHSLVACDRIAAKGAPSVSCREADECRSNEKGLKLEDSHVLDLMSVGSTLTGEKLAETV